MNPIKQDLTQRKSRLQKLSQLLDSYRDEFLSALHTDLDKPPLESMNSEWVLLQEEVRYAMKHLERWMKPKTYKSPLIIKPAHAWIKAEPLGKVLILAPWNYPLYLALAPVIGALAAGNTIVLKPSEKTPTIANLLEKSIQEYFTPDVFRVVNGGADVAAKLLDEHWDKVLFTGSNHTGQKVYEACARNMTPVVLELGGKNPVYINPQAPLKQSLKRIFWGKFFNAGQTCVAPDFLLLPSTHLAAFKQIGPELLKEMYESPDSLQQAMRLKWQRERMNRLLEASKIYGDQILYGGEWRGEILAPTLIILKDSQSPLMQEEIFGPL